IDPFISNGLTIRPNLGPGKQLTTPTRESRPWRIPAETRSRRRGTGETWAHHLADEELRASPAVSGAELATDIRRCPGVDRGRPRTRTAHTRIAGRPEAGGRIRRPTGPVRGGRRPEATRLARLCSPQWRAQRPTPSTRWF